MGWDSDTVCAHGFREMARTMLPSWSSPTTPSGNPEPSRADKEATTKIIEAGNILNINLLAHFILGNNQHYSFFAHSLIPKYPPRAKTLHSTNNPPPQTTAPYDALRFAHHQIRKSRPTVEYTKFMRTLPCVPRDGSM
jgi:hypothetical protein